MNVPVSICPTNKRESMTMLAMHLIVLAASVVAVAWLLIIAYLK
jgi:hypothetical protein